MTDLATLADIAEVLGLFVVVGGAVFAIIQIHHFRRQRQETASFEFLRSVQSREFRMAYPLVFAIPDGLSAAEIRERGPETLDAIETINWVGETIGVMVYERAINLAAVDRLMGGLMRISWRRASPYLLDMREQTGNARYAEWFQWLAEQLERHGDGRRAEGAYVLHRDWRP